MQEGRSILKPEDIKALFSSIELIRSLNLNFLFSFKQHFYSSKVQLYGDLFLSNVPSPCTPHHKHCITVFFESLNDDSFFFNRLPTLNCTLTMLITTTVH